MFVDRSRARVSAVAGAVIVAASMVSSCGGGSSNASGTDGAFCNKLRQLQTMPQSDDPTEAVKQLADLAKVAPNDEVRSAMAALAPLIDKIDAIDTTKEDAFAEIMALMFSPEVIKAGEVIDGYAKDVCGIDTSDTSSTVAPSGDSSGMGGNVMDDLDAGDIGDAISAELAAVSPDTDYSGTSMSYAGDSTLIEVDLGGGAGYDADSICRVVLDYVAENSSDDAIEVNIRHDGSVVASCTP